MITKFPKRQPRYRFVLRLFAAVALAAGSITGCNEEENLVYPAQINYWYYLTEQNGLASDYVHTIFEDSRGDFWIGTNFGLSFFDGTTITNYTTRDGLLDNNVYALGEDRNGDIWIGTPRGLNIFTEGKLFYFSYFYNAPVYALHAMENDGGILIGTGGYGIYRYDYETEGFGLYSYIDECRGCNSINALFQARDGAVWVATFQGARKIRGSFITQFDTDDGLAGDIVTTISEDSWGNIWVGTVEGKTISKISGNTVSQVSLNNGSDENFIFGIQEDNNGDLWVGTVENGLFKYDGAIMRRVENGPPDGTITALLKDTGGNLWVGSVEEGVAVYITNPLK